MESELTGRKNSINKQAVSTEKSTRLYYLDWLQVLAVLGVFLFHAVHPFDDIADWHIKNVEKSILATFFVGYFNLWGMPFFFLMAGATSWFSLRRRTAGRYVRERVSRLLIPFIIGALVLTPFQAFYELRHKGWWQGDSLIEFILSTEARSYFYTEYHQLTFGTEIFGRIGYRLWYLAYQFIFALISLPVFIWLNGDNGKRFTAWLARFADWRGGLLVFVIPLLITRFLLQPYFPAYTGWADFAFLLIFFMSGYILISEERFRQAIFRDWWLYLVLGITCTLFFFLCGSWSTCWGLDGVTRYPRILYIMGFACFQQLVLDIGFILRRDALPGFHQQISPVQPGSELSLLLFPPARDHIHRFLRSPMAG